LIQRALEIATNACQGLVRKGLPLVAFGLAACADPAATSTPEPSPEVEARLLSDDAYQLLEGQLQEDCPSPPLTTLDLRELGADSCTRSKSDLSVATLQPGDNPSFSVEGYGTADCPSQAVIELEGPSLPALKRIALSKPSSLAGAACAHSFSVVSAFVRRESGDFRLQGRYGFVGVETESASGRCELLTLDQGIASSDESFADAPQSFVSFDAALSNAAAVRLAVTFVTGCELSPVQLTLATYPAMP
jgi:hypothetical protein